MIMKTQISTTLHSDHPPINFIHNNIQPCISLGIAINDIDNKKHQVIHMQTVARDSNWTDRTSLSKKSSVISYNEGKEGCP